MPEIRPSALGDVIEAERDLLLDRWRAQVRQLPSARHLDTPTLTDHIPRLVSELVAALRSTDDVTIIESVVATNSAPAHGVQRFDDDFDIEEVVAEYNLLRATIHDLATERGLPLQGRPFHVLNRLLDSAIGAAVQAYVTKQSVQMQQRREDHLAFVAHDLRNPLNAISLTARVLEELLLAPENDTARAQLMLRTLSRNVARMVELVGKVIEENTHLSSDVGFRLQRREFELWPVIEGLLMEMRPLADAKRTRLVNVVPEECVVFADASQLRRVFQNLVANAIKYTPRGTVTIGAVETADAGAFECFVQDDGDGIAEDRRDTVFNKHESDAQHGDGLGLGLAIVKSIVEAHEGRVWVKSELGRGATFRFTLPARSHS